jgi:predicted ATPase
LFPHSIEAINKEIQEAKRSTSPEANGRSMAATTSYVHHRQLRYRIEIRIRPQSGMLQVADEYLAALGRDGKPKSSPKPFIGGSDALDRRLRLRREGQAHPTYFDENLDHAIISRPHYPPHYLHLAAFKRELQSWFFYYFEPRERMRATASVKEVRHIGLMGEELAAFLNTMKNSEPRQLEAVEMAMHSLIPSITGIITEVNKFGEVELSLKEGKVAMPARVVSEGTLRTLGLLALNGVKDRPALVGFEEPENGIHPRRITQIAKLISGQAESGTQLIVTTHSPVLPDHVPKESLFVCNKKEGATTIEPYRSWGPLFHESAVGTALDKEEGLPPSQRMMRGDFDA